MELRQRRQRPFDLLYRRAGDRRFHAGCGGCAVRHRGELAILLRRYFRRAGFVFFPAVTELDAQGESSRSETGLSDKLEVHVPRVDFVRLNSDVLGARFFSTLGRQRLC